MKPFIEQAQTYAAYHQKPVTRYTHLLGVPLILFSFMILLGFFHVVLTGVFDVNVANITTVVLLIYYFRLQWRLALALTPLLILLLWLAAFLSHDGPTSSALWLFFIIFLLGAALQFTGHFIEEKRPALVDNVWQVFIAPLFMVAELFFMAGRMTELKEEIYGKKTSKPSKETSKN